MKRLLTTLAAAALVLTAPPLAALADSHSLTITNNASQAVEYINISPVDSTVWGSDWLEPTDVLAPGQKVTFAITTGCMQDIRVTFMDQHQAVSRSFDTCTYDLVIHDPTSTS